MTKTETQTNRQKLPFFQTVFGCYDILFSKFWSLTLLGGLFALLTTTIFFISGQDLLCFKSEYSSSHFCTTSPANYIIIHLVIFFINFLFMEKWVELIAKGKDFSWKKVLLPDLGTLKMIGLFLSYMVTIGIACFSIYLLYIRVPNPNWKIELTYFTVVSVGFIFPIMGIRFFVYFAYAAKKRPLPSIKDIWKKTAGNMFAIISGCSLISILALFLSQTIMQQIIAAKPIISHALFLEFLSQFFVFVVLSCFMNYCYIQENFFEEEPKDGK